VPNFATFKNLASLFLRLRRALARPPQGAQELSPRFLFLEKEIILPAKGLILILVAYHLFFSQWGPQASGTMDVVIENAQSFFPIYVAINVLQAFLLFFGHSRLGLPFLYWVVFTGNLIDSLFFSMLAVATSGIIGPIFWIFPILVIRNAVTISLGTSQIALNVVVSLFYLSAGLIDARIQSEEMGNLSYYSDQLPKSQKALARKKKTVVPSDIQIMSQVLREPVEAGEKEGRVEGMILRLTILWLMTGWCYGLQLLVAKQRQSELEAQEFGIRQDQLQTAGRLAAEIAHKLKNPLGIINNACFSLQKGMGDQKKSNLEQIGIIREEVEKADRILTELMGYAQLAEGKVERLNVNEELDRAIDQVFPAGASYSTEIERRYGHSIPTLLMQRNHLSEVFVNILQNAREAMSGAGRIMISSRIEPNYMIRVDIEDFGPGIPKEHLPKVFEPYFTTKEKGTGLGLAIVKHNAELYGGMIQIESELGIGTRFHITLPSKPVLKLRK
jgi:signal transduction histidine kinase